MAKRKLCIVTGTRAEYGLLYWLMKEIQDDPALELQIVATGMHLSPDFGLTYKTIEADGFKINEKVDLKLNDDSPVGITKSTGHGLIGFADAFDRLKPDVIVVLGDRYEILAAVQAALFAKIPVAHLFGGESSEGQTDESIRHAVTKMSHLHFVAAEPYRQRVIQMGEDPDAVYNFGTLGFENIQKMKFPAKPELEKELNFNFGLRTFLITMHPVTLDSKTPEFAMMELFKSLDRFPDAHLIFTKSNSDTHGRIINEMIDQYVAKNSARAVVFTSLGQYRYLSTLKYADAVIGNSSSGIIEAPFMKKATVNIGERQKGRLMASSVISCGENAAEIEKAMQTALSESFRKKLEKTESPYSAASEPSKKIKDVLKTHALGDGLIRKSFHEKR